MYPNEFHGRRAMRASHLKLLKPYDESVDALFDRMPVILDPDAYDLWLFRSRNEEYFPSEVWRKLCGGMDEPPYALGEAARLLGVSRGTSKRLFYGEEGVLVLSVPGARHKMRRIPRPVFNRVLNRLSQPRTTSPYFPCKFRQPMSTSSIILRRHAGIPKRTAAKCRR